MNNTEIPIRPKRGQLLVAIDAKRVERTAGGILLPPELDNAIDVAEVLELGLPVYHIGSGQEKAWDYAPGDRILLNTLADRAQLPFRTADGRELSLIGEGHVWGLYTKPVEPPAEPEPEE